MSGAQYIEHGNGRPWHKRVLIPFWVIQILFMGIQVVSAAFGIYWASNVNNSTTISSSNGSTIYTSNSGNSNTITSSDGSTVSYTTFSSAIIALYAIILALALIGLLLSFIEIILFARHHLTPTKYFVFNLLKFLGWTALFCVGIANAVLYGTYVLSLVVNIVVELVFIGTLIYASVIFHRFRRERRMGVVPGQATKEPYTSVNHA